MDGRPIGSAGINGLGSEDYNHEISHLKVGETTHVLY